MKVNVSFPMSEQMYNIIFPTHNIETKHELIIVLLEVARYIINICSYKAQPVAYKNSAIVLFKERTSRLYFVTDDKQYSIGFPFSIITDASGKITAFEYEGVTLTSIVFVASLQILKGDDWKSTAVIDFATPIDYWCDQFNNISDECAYAGSFWPFLRGLMLYDDGYLRYDYDEKHYQEDNPKYHPKHHLHGGFHCDVAYRAGLNPPFTADHFSDFTDVNTDSWFIGK